MRSPRIGSLWATAVGLASIRRDWPLLFAPNRQRSARTVREWDSAFTQIAPVPRGVRIALARLKIPFRAASVRESGKNP